MDAFAVQDVATGGFFTVEYIPRERGPSRYRPVWAPDPFSVYGWQHEAAVDRLLAHFSGVPDDDRILWAIQLPSILIGSQSGWEATHDAVIEERLVRKVRSPACGCCGANPWGRDRPLRNLKHVGDGQWRCERHLGRIPCCIEGCGKTWAIKPGEDYSWRCICGRHWRESPKRLRVCISKVRRTAKRRGWSARLVKIHDWLWERAVDRVVRGHRRVIDLGEIVPSSDPPPAALLTELERLGL